MPVRDDQDGIPALRQGCTSLLKAAIRYKTTRRQNRRWACAVDRKAPDPAVYETLIHQPSSSYPGHESTWATPLGFTVCWFMLYSTIYLDSQVVYCRSKNLGHAVAQCLRHCATNQKVAGSIPDWHNHSGRTMPLGSTQPLTETIIRDFSCGLMAADT